MRYLNELMREFRSGAAAAKLNIIANVLAIPGLSFLTVISLLEKFSAYNLLFAIGESFFGFAIVTFFLALSAVALILFSGIKPFFTQWWGSKGAFIHSLFWLFVLFFCLAVFLTFGLMIVRDLIVQPFDIFLSKA